MLIRTTAALAGAALLLAGSAIASAAGTATIVKSSGDTKIYDPVRIHMLGDSSVRIDSADGRGTLTIVHAACSFSGDLRRCLPYAVTLKQRGVTRPIEIERGTLYLNATDAALPLPHSSMKVPAHSIMLGLRTQRGTSICVTGRVDGASQ
jgi:hypothetical protein